MISLDCCRVVKSWDMSLQVSVRLYNYNLLTFKVEISYRICESAKSEGMY